MTNHARLDNVTHKDLTVKHCYAVENGANVGAVVTFPNEFAQVAREYPIMLSKDSATDSYQSMAMLGLSPHENLFLQEGEQSWNGHYVPAALARGPFMIGYEDQTQSGGAPNAAVVHIDMDDGRVNVEGGTPVFKAHGGNTHYLDSITNVLLALDDGVALGNAMLTKFDELGLIEPVAMDIELVNGDQLRVEGQYTINNERFNALSGDQLFEMNQAGYLSAAFSIMNSLDNVNRLIALKNQSIAAGVS